MKVLPRLCATKYGPEVLFNQSFGVSSESTIILPIDSDSRPSVQQRALCVLHRD